MTSTACYHVSLPASDRTVLCNTVAQNFFSSTAAEKTNNRPEETALQSNSVASCILQTASCLLEDHGRQRDPMQLLEFLEIRNAEARAQNLQNTPLLWGMPVISVIYTTANVGHGVLWLCVRLRAAAAGCEWSASSGSAFCRRGGRGCGGTTCRHLSPHSASPPPAPRLLQPFNLK